MKMLHIASGKVIDVFPFTGKDGKVCFVSSEYSGVRFKPDDLRPYVAKASPTSSAEVGTSSVTTVAVDIKVGGTVVIT